MDCYDAKNHTCDGRCQGACNCPWADWDRDYSVDPVTREEMARYIVVEENQVQYNKQLIDEMLKKKG